MPKVLSAYEGKESDVYDRASGRTCLILKAVDITDACPERDPTAQVRLEYLRDSRGMKLVVQNCYPGKDYGSYPFFDLDALDPDRFGSGQGATFRVLAEILGLEPAAFLELVRAHRPETPSVPVLGPAPERILF